MSFVGIYVGASNNPVKCTSLLVVDSVVRVSNSHFSPLHSSGESDPVVYVFGCCMRTCRRNGSFFPLLHVIGSKSVHDQIRTVVWAED